MCCLNTVYFRHHMIHEYEIKFLLLYLAYCILCTCCSVNLHIKRLEKTLGNCKVDSIVVYNKNLCVRCCKREIISFKVGKGRIVFTYTHDGVKRKNVNRLSYSTYIYNVETFETFAVFYYYTLELRIVCYKLLHFLSEQILFDKYKVEVQCIHIVFLEKYSI